MRLEARGLRKSYWTAGRELQVLRGVDLCVGPGQVLAITGPSGSGKSTLLRLLGALERPTAGTVRYDGQDPFGLPDGQLSGLRNRKVGFVFQFYHLLEDFTAAENVMMPLLLRGLPPREARRRALRMLEEVGLADRARHRPRELSGGEQQRVALARALVGEPELVLADEPTGSLDPASGETVMELLLEMARRRGASVVVATHNEAVAERIGWRMRLCDGRLC